MGRGPRGEAASAGGAPGAAGARVTGRLGLLWEKTVSNRLSFKLPSLCLADTSADLQRAGQMDLQSRGPAFPLLWLCLSPGGSWGEGPCLFPWGSTFLGRAVGSRPAPKGSLEPPGRWEAQRPGWPPTLPHQGQARSAPPAGRGSGMWGVPRGSHPALVRSLQTACRGDPLPGEAGDQGLKQPRSCAEVSRQSRPAGSLVRHQDASPSLDWGELALFIFFNIFY